MTAGPAPVRFLRPYTPEELHAALRDRVESLRLELGAEMAARARAEAQLERDKEELTEMWCRANRECERQRLMLASLTRLVRGAVLDRLAVLVTGVLLGLAIAEWLGP